MKPCDDDNQPAFTTGTENSRVEALRSAVEVDIKRLKRFANRGLWAFSLFLVVCMLAWQDFPLLPLPEKVVASLGPPPSSQMISMLLLIYTFSAIILSLSRMMGNIEHKSSFCHVGYLAGFFLFYHFAKELDNNYWAVFGAGVTILGVESYRIWTYCSEAISKKNEQLAFIIRTGRAPIEEEAL
jgi:hypothetical protein